MLINSPDCQPTGAHSFAVSLLSVWNSLPDNLRDLKLSAGIFKCSLKPFSMHTTVVTTMLQHIRDFVPMQYMNLLLD